MPEKVLVSLRAVLQRLNRRLAHENQVLKAARGRSGRQVGHYYAVSLRSKTITADHVDPITWAQEFGLLQPWETVEGQEQAPTPPPELSPPDEPPYNVHTLRLGSLCKYGHDYTGKGESLRRLIGGTCEECRKANQRKRP